MKNTGFIDDDFETGERLVNQQSWDPLDKDWKWDEFSTEEKAEQERLMETYAAMMDRVDQNIGRLMAHLEQLGVDDNTIVFFLSDNGGSPYSVQDVPGSDPGPPGTFRTLNTPWAEVNSAPFRFFKQYSHEGGVSTALVVRWPQGQIGQGRRSKQPYHVIDFMPTLVELAGAEYPETRYGDPVLPMAGRSFVPVLKNEKDGRGRQIFWDFRDNPAIRDGKWKLVQNNIDQKWELYDIDADRGETNDLVASKPEIVKRLQMNWQAWQETMNNHATFID